MGGFERARLPFRFCMAAVWFAALACPASAQIFGAILPQARSTVPNGVVTAFATIINAGPTLATNCRIVVADASFGFQYQATNTFNQPIGSPNTAVSIPSNQAQQFVISFRPTSTRYVLAAPSFVCDGQTAPRFYWTNDFVLNVDTVQQADIIPIAITPSGDGVLRIPSAGGTGIMVASAVNIGPSSTITVEPIAGLTPDTTFATRSAPVALSVVETDAQGNQLTAPAESLTRTFSTGQVRYFTVLATSTGYAGLPLQPGDLRTSLLFVDGAGRVRGLTSSAVTSPTPQNAGNLPSGIWDGVFRNSFGDVFVGYMLVGPDGRLAYFTRYLESAVGNTASWSWETAFGNVAVAPQSATGGSFTGSSVVYDGGARTGTANIAGTYTAATELSAGYAALPPSIGTGLVSAFYSDANQFRPTLADLAGNYDLQDPVATSSATVTTGGVSISASGVVDGMWFGCPLTGSVSRIPDNNLFSVAFSVTLGAQGCLIPQGVPTQYSGLGAKLGVDSPFPSGFNLPLRDYLALLVEDSTRQFSTIGLLARK
jgi:hypothetical protein